MWSAGLAEWFAGNGRHDLPWRLTTDPWAVLVSEVMLQQTSVARVLPRWDRFVARWPSPVSCAAATLDDVLREWHGLGYPRRARALWLCAAQVTDGGWPRDEAGLRRLPGIGAYTARALLAFSSLGGAATAAAPRDVNLGRVAARAALGREVVEVTPAALDAVLREGRPAGMAMREYAYALFDVGALHCWARPRCLACPLRDGCLRVHRGAAPATGRRRSPRYEGSLRQLRGTVLAQALASPRLALEEIAAAAAGAPGATPERIRAALDGLIADGLIAATDESRR
jgi:A/G-specific adenine glycosylase